MNKQQLIKMIISVILPPVMVIVLFAVAIGAVMIPATEDALMQKKRDMIQAIVMSATSIIERHAQMEKEGLVSKEVSQQAALIEMKALRYGSGNKDYLWITDLQPSMVMHPYLPDLEGIKLDRYSDSEGKLLFVEAVEIATHEGAGYINYMWPKQDNLKEPVPKLSYIRLFEPWGWVVGSGIYLDDVHAEIKSVTLRLLKISGWIGAIVVVLLLFVIRRGWESEKGRCLAETELLRSRERYQALAHASGEMVFLTIDGIIAGANKMACKTLGKDEAEIISHSFAEFIADSSGLDMIATAEAGGTMEAFETVLQGKNGLERILLSAEHAIVHESPAIMYAGYSLKLKADPDNGLIMQDFLSKSGFGMIKLENTISGKILAADKLATSLLTSNDETSVVGKIFRSLVNEGDASRLFIQLQTDDTVRSMLLRYTSKLSDRGYLQAWAAISEDAGNSLGNVIVFLTDVTELQLVYQASDALLSELLSPEKRLSHGPGLLDSAPSEASLSENYVRTEVLLRQSVKMGLAPERVTAARVHSINHIFRTATEKAIVSLGPPPCNYALLAFGSIGRSEPTLNADQDTGIIYESKEDEATCSEYFQRFGVLVTAFCAEVGIPPCPAGNTAANPALCLSEAAWRDQFSSWINKNQPKDLVLVNIFFDFRVVSGDDNLASMLRRHIFREVEKRSAFLFNLAQDTLDFRSPSNMLGRIRSDSRTSNYVNLKGTMLHFVNFARIYSLKNAINETNTLKRLQVLTDAKHIPSDTGQDTIDAWKFLLKLRLKIQVSARELNFPQENTLILEELSSWEEAMLKRAMGQVNNLQKRITLDITRVG